MTSKIKKLLGLMMAIVIILSVGFGSRKVFVAGETNKNGSITVKGTTNGKTYSAYKIFDLTYTDKDENKKVSYTISEEWKDFFGENGAGAGYIVDMNEGGNLNPITVEGKTKYIKITDDNVAEFAKAAMGELSSKTKAGTEKATSDSVTISNLPLGYYLVHPEGATEKKDTQNSIVSLTSTTPKADVQVKGTYPTVKKQVDKKTADIGQELNYTLTSKVPDTTGYSEYTFKMTDTLSKGLTFISNSDNVEVKIGDEIITTNVTKKVEDKNLEVSFDMLKLQDKVGKEIKITYKAKLNKDAVITGENPNTVTLEYSNDPKDNNKKDKTTDKEKVFTAKVIVNKVDGKDKTTPLEGAKFKLKNDQDKYYKVDPNTKEVTWVDKIQATEVETKIVDENATASFEGLAVGKYKLVETKAPDGYNLLTTEIDVEIKATDKDGVVTGIADGVAKVENNSGVELPGTGGMGTTLFAVFGGGIILIALYSLVKEKLKKKGNR